MDRRLVDFVHPDDVERTNDAVAKIFQGEEMSDFSNRYRAANGEWRWLTWQAVYDPEEQLVFASATDTTESRRISRLLADLNEALEQRAAELERSNADLQQFASIASHELREPLRTISGFARLIERRYADQIDERADSYINFILQGVDRMSSLIEALLQFSRVGQSAVDPIDVDTDALVGNVIHDMQSTIESNNADVTAGSLPAIEADPHLIAWIFQNLISNAIKYCEQPKPRVRIEGVAVADGWEFAVTDNGIGIDPKHADRIFAIFQRLHGREEYSGTGIGLAVCKRAVELHGGSIWVEPAAGGGSKFIFKIPFPAGAGVGGAK
jgi:light-regulated signal transduction histidine kinase (bacteriophytochrome)